MSWIARWKEPIASQSAILEENIHDDARPPLKIPYASPSIRKRTTIVSIVCLVHTWLNRSNSFLRRSPATLILLELAYGRSCIVCLPTIEHSNIRTQWFIFVSATNIVNLVIVAFRVTHTCPCRFVTFGLFEGRVAGEEIVCFQHGSELFPITVACPATMRAHEGKRKCLCAMAS